MGSSLRVQGRLFTEDFHEVLIGFIPACAGATIIKAGRQRLHTVHPCVCRGDLNAVDIGNLHSGSSLRVQGRQAMGDCGFSRKGFIPACAGATPDGTQPSHKDRVHPCVCRGDVGPAGCGKSHMGSSLRVQGRQTNALVLSRHIRFIPACAGATRKRWHKHSMPRVHPCVCRGDRSVLTAVVPWLGSSLRVQGRPIPKRCLGPEGGSSLRVQGRRFSPWLPWGIVGFIPACAGATPTSHDEPGCIGGSSLRVQGRHAGNGAHVTGIGFIPACAGATVDLARGLYRRRVHPCVCRGDLAGLVLPKPVMGSSLRVQGRH